MSWEDEDFEPPAVEGSASRWADEDKEDAPVKSSWDEEEPKQKGEPKQSSTYKPAAKKSAKAAQKTEPQQPAAPLDPATEKKLKQKFVEDSDFQNTQDIFAGIDERINVNQPKDEKDFEALADSLSQKLTVFEKSIHYKSLLKRLFRQTCAGLKADEVKDLASALTILQNERLKQEKDKAKGGKKKVTTKKASLNMKEGLDDEDGFVDDEFSAF